jgi:predicted dehydrogenase
MPEILVTGFGHVARNSYLPACRDLQLPVVGIVEPDSARAADAAGHAPCFAHIPNAADTTEDCPLALNLTPAPLHEEITRSLLDAGWNVLSEKPAARTPPRWDGLVQRASDLGLVLLSAPFLAHSATMQELRKFIESMPSGFAEISVDLVREGPASEGLIDPDRDWFFAPGLGPLWDLGIYGATFLASLFGRPETVTAEACDHPIDLGTRGSRTRVTGSIRQYRAVAGWPRVAASMDVGYSPVARDPYNITVALGGHRASASMWDYALPVRYDGNPGVLPAEPVEARKYVHGLAEACRLLDDPAAVLEHQSTVRHTLELLHQIEAAAT